MAFASNRDGDYEIYVVNSDGSNPTRLTFSTSQDLAPTWSPDGTRIAFVSNRAGNYDIVVMRSDGTGQRRLTTDPASDVDPAWSPSGNKIAFASDRTGDYDVYGMRINGASQTNITNSPAGEDTAPAWSADAASIAFTSDRDGNSEIYEMLANGTQQTNLTGNVANDSDPFYAPDQGSRIGFTSDRDGNDEIYLMRATDGADQVNIVHDGGGDYSGAWQPLPAYPPSGSPIQHVVIVYMENHSFNELLGGLCLALSRCDATDTGVLLDGSTIPLARGQDIVPVVGHSGNNMITAVNGGLMNGWQLIPGCEPDTGYACYVQYQQDQIPTTWDLATTYALSDRTFQLDYVSSWGSHLEIVSSQLDGFEGKIPKPGEDGNGPGWGCDSLKDTKWHATVFDDPIIVPSCVPMIDGSGPYRVSPVSWVPTIMDRMDQSGIQWKMYVPDKGEHPAYGWAICPNFSNCIYTDQLQNILLPEQFATDAAAGTLPSVSIVVPHDVDSQHNGLSMIQGENWIAQQVSAVMDGPLWNSTAIFITWDDCGCFYDHVPPPEDLGVRIPMVIVSPWVRPAFTDSNVASYNSMLAFIEHTLGLAPLSPRDAEAYDYSQTFDFTQIPLRPIPLPQHPVPRSSIEYVKRHPPDHSDPT